MIKNDMIIKITNDMAISLTLNQLEKIKEVLKSNFENIEISELTDKNQMLEKNNLNLINVFISSKKVEGCSERTIKYYEYIISKLINTLNKDIKEITTDDIRKYLSNYKEYNKCTAVTIDNLRRVFSSFFSWLEDEDYIIKSPVRRIHKVKTTKVIKETFTDENIEKMRDECIEIRNLV